MLGLFIAIVVEIKTELRLSSFLGGLIEVVQFRGSCQCVVKGEDGEDEG